MKAILLMGLLILSCGKGTSDEPSHCRPQEIAIAQCQVEEFEKNPSRSMLEQQKRICENRYPYNMCYYN